MKHYKYKPAVVVDWIDASSESQSWKSVNDVKRHYEYKVRSVGLLISEYKEGVVIATNDCAEGDVSCLMRIPRGVIRRIRRLR